MTHQADPRMVEVENWLSQMHARIFDASANAQAVVSYAQKNLKDIPSDNEDFMQLHREFEISSNVYLGKHAYIDALINATTSLQTQSNVTRLHCAQVFAAANCTICCQRMLDAIPDDLQQDETVVGGLVNQLNGHLAMWRHLTNTVIN